MKLTYQSSELLTSQKKSSRQAQRCQFLRARSWSRSSTPSCSQLSRAYFRTSTSHTIMARDILMRVTYRYSACKSLRSLRRSWLASSSLGLSISTLEVSRLHSPQQLSLLIKVGHSTTLIQSYTRRRPQKSQMLRVGSEEQLSSRIC